MSGVSPSLNTNPNAKGGSFGYDSRTGLGYGQTKNGGLGSDWSMGDALSSPKGEWDNELPINNPGKEIVIGPDTSVRELAIAAGIIEIDDEKRRVSLSLKQCLENPWKIFEDNHSKGDIIKSQIKSITDFGIFVGLEGGIDGLIHITDISKTDDQEEAIRKFKKGEEVESIILSVDSDRERVSLGIKQLEAES